MSVSMLESVCKQESELNEFYFILSEESMC